MITQNASLIQSKYVLSLNLINCININTIPTSHYINNNYININYYKMGKKGGKGKGKPVVMTQAEFFQT